MASPTQKTQMVNGRSTGDGLHLIFYFNKDQKDHSSRILRNTPDAGFYCLRLK